jgi:ABC-type proline/glycine betaine transport system substrate-binding protein
MKLIGVFRPAAVIDRNYEERHHAHYGWAPHWMIRPATERFGEARRHPQPYEH